MNILTELDDGRVAIISTDDTLKTGDSIDLKSSNGACVVRVVKEVVYQVKSLSIVTLEDLPPPKPVNIFKKLKDGSWGALVVDKSAKVGDVITLKKRDGSEQYKVVETILEDTPEGLLITFAEVPKSKKVNNDFTWEMVWETWGVSGEVQAGLRSDGAWFYRFKNGASNYKGGSVGRWGDWYETLPFEKIDASFTTFDGDYYERFKLRHTVEKFCKFNNYGYEPKRLTCPQQPKKEEFAKYNGEDTTYIEQGRPVYY